MHIKNNRERVRTHRIERYDKGEFQQTGKFEWWEASYKLTYGGFKLWMWLADNCNGYEYDLSPTAIKNALKMPDNTYCRAKQNLIDNGYLVLADDGWFDYYMYGRPDWHNGDEPYFQNGSIKYLDTSKMEGNYKVPSKMEASKMEVSLTENTSKMEGNTSKMEVLTSKMEGDTPNLLPFWGDKYTSNIQISNLSTEAHPSGSLEHPTDAAPSTTVPEPKKKKKIQDWDDKSKKEYLDTLDDDKLEKIDYLLSVGKRYNEIYETENIEKYCLDDSSRYQITEILNNRKKERKIEKDKKDILASIDNDSSALSRLSEYMRLSPEDVKDNLVKYGMKPDVLIDCFEDNELYRYEQWDQESKKTYPSHLDWVWTLYESNVINAGDVNLGSSVVGSSSSHHDKIDDLVSIDSVMDDEFDLSWLDD